MVDEATQPEDDDGFKEQWEAYDEQARVMLEMTDIDEKLAGQLAKQRKVAFRSGWLSRGGATAPTLPPAWAAAQERGRGTAPSSDGQAKGNDPREGLTPVVEWLDPGDRAFVVPFNAIVEKAERVDKDAGVDGFKGLGTYFVDMRSIIYSEESDEATVMVENREGKLYAMGPRDKHRLRDMPFVDKKLVEIHWLDG